VRKGLLIHGPIVTTRDACCLRYGSPKRSESSPVLPDGSTGKYGAGNVRINAERLQFPASNRENKRVSGFVLTNPEVRRRIDRMSYRREIVNRILANSGATLGIAVLGISLAIAGVGLAQTKSTKKAAPAGKDAAAVARGKEVFQQKCSTCHYDTSDAKKIGPGLKGIGKRGTFTVNNNKVTDESLKTWIENGDSLMPPFKDVIDDNQIKDVIAYVKTL